MYPPMRPRDGLDLLLTPCLPVPSSQPGARDKSPPKLTTYDCDENDCKATERSVVLDANWRWLRKHKGGSTQWDNCYDASGWHCTDQQDCDTKCVLEGIDEENSFYSTTYGITSDKDTLTLQYKVGTNVGSRNYLMNADHTQYELFHLNNRELTMTVDDTNVPCGVNGAVYLVPMDADGTDSVPLSRAQFSALPCAHALQIC